jgi:hypothetical protein
MKSAVGLENCTRMRRIGQAVNSTIDAATVVTAPATKASPPKAPRSASAMENSDKSAIRISAPPAPSPTCRASSSPNSAVSQPAVQPRRPMPSDWAQQHQTDTAGHQQERSRRSREPGSRDRRAPAPPTGPAPATICRARGFAPARA